MPPETPLSQPAAIPPSSPRNPLHRWRRWALVIVIALVILSGIGFGFSKIFSGLGTPKSTPTPTPAAPLTNNERSQVTEQPLSSTQLVVTDLTAQNADVTTLVVKALHVLGATTLDQNLTVNGSGAFTGTIQAANFEGNGSGLTNINAALLGGQPGSYYRNLANSTGTVSASQLPSSVALRNAANTFTAANTFSGLLNASGTVAISGPATFSGGATINSLTLGAALPVSSGGTGLSGVANQGILYGQGGGSLGIAVPGGSGLCLLSGVTDVAWGVCGGGGAGVASVNGLTGVISIANATPSGSTITINDASTGAKGIASFNGTNFSVSAGAVNTIQNINSGATPTFAGVNANALTPSAALTVGAITQALTMQGSATTITSTSGANTTTLNFQAPTANITYTLLTAPNGAYDICTTVGNCVGTGGGVTASGGVAGTLPKFTGVQTLGPSLITDNGALVTVGGNFSVTGSVSLTSALTVANGGTGTGNFTSNGVVIGQGTSPLTTVTSGSPGECLISTVGAPSFQSCPGGGGVLTLNGLAGTLSVANATGSGATITINDATTGAKGIASYNSTNFTVTSGAVNTIQNISATSDPTFRNLALTSAALTGASAATTVLSSRVTGDTNDRLTVGADGLLSWGSGAAGADVTLGRTAANTIGISQSFTAAGTVTVGAGSSLAKLTVYPTTNGTIGQVIRGSAGHTADLLQLQDNSGNVNAAFSALGNQLTLGRIAGSGTVTPGILVLGDGTTDNFGATIQTGTLLGNRTYTLPDPGTGSANICLSTGNCAGLGGAVGGSGTANALAKFTVTGSTIGDSIITDNGATVGIGGILAVNTITPTAAATFGATTQNLTVQGGATTRLTATSGGITNTLQFATPSGLAKNISIPNASGTVAVSGSGPIAVDINGNITCTGCVTSGGGGGGAGAVDSLNGLTGAVILANSGVSGNNVIIDDATTGAKGIASFSSTNFSVTSGAVNTIQNITTTSDPTFRNLSLATASISSSQASAAMLFVNNTNVSAAGNLIDLQLGGASRFSITPAGAVTAGTINGQTISGTASFTGTVNVASTLGVNTITPSSSLTIGATGQTFLLQGDAGSTITANGGAGATTVGFTGTPTGAVRYEFDRAAPPSTYTICTTAGNCSGSAPTLQGAYNGSTTPEITVNGANGAVTIRDNASAIGANLLEVQSNGGGTTYLGVGAGGISVTGAAAVTGDINSTTGGLRTNGATRIDNGGNLVGIGDLTAMADITIASTGAGNNITLASPNEVIVNASQLTVNAPTLLNDYAVVNLTGGDDLYIEGNPTGTQAVDVLNLHVFNSTTSGTQRGLLVQNMAGTGVTDALLSLDNDDTNTAVTTGLHVTSAAGAITTAIDVSDSDIGTAIALGANDISGSAFSVNGSTGDVTSGLVNGQTINGSASFTGTLNVASTATVQGASLAIGTTSVAGSLILSDGSNNTPSITVAPTTFDTVYTLPAVAGASATICLTTGNCAGTGSGVTTSGGTPGRLVKFSATQAVDNSIITESGSIISFTGTLAVTTAATTTGATIDTSAATSGSGLSVTGTASGSLGAYSGTQINTSLTRTSTTSVTDTGKLLSATRSNTINGGGQTFTVNGDLATLSSNCTQTAGTCTDASHILSLYQQYANATGAVLSVRNAGTGSTLELLNSGGTPTFTVASTGNVASSGTYNTNTFTGSSLQFGSAATIQAAASQALNITAHSASTWSTDSGSLDITASTNLNLGNGGGGTIAVGTNAASHTIDIGTSTSGTQAITLGNIAAAGTTTINGGTTAGLLFQSGAGITLDAATNISTEDGFDTTSYLAGPTGGIGQYANLLTVSEQFDNATWVKTNITAITPDTIVAPDGQTTAEVLADSSSGGNAAQTSATAATANDYTFSVWLKASGTATAELRIDGASSGTGTARTANVTSTWKRFIVTQNATGFTGNMKVLIFPGGTGGSNTVHAWGAQLVRANNAQVYARAGASNVTASRGIVANGDINMTSGAFLQSGTGSFTTGTGLVNLNGSTTVAAGQTLTVTSALTSLTGAGTGDAFNVSNAASTGNIAVFKDNATAVMTIADGGAVSLQNTVDSTAAFRVMTSAGGTNVPLIQVNTSATNTGTYVMGTGTGSGGGRIFFGSGTGDADVFVGEDSTTDTDILALSGRAGIKFFTNGANQVGIISANGKYTLNSTNDSFGGLVYQNFNGGSPLDLFNVSTADNTVTIGRGSTTDTSAVLFVLDGYNTLADPSGVTVVEGAMYYNQKTATFRCYEGARWTECLGVPKPNTRRWTYLTYPGSGTTWDLNGDIATAGTAPTAVAASTTNPGMLNYATGTSTNDTNSAEGNLNYNTSSNPQYQTYAVLSSTANLRTWYGLTDQTAATMQASATPTGNYAAFRFDNGAGDTNYKCVTANAGTQTVTGTAGFGSPGTTGHKLEIIIVNTTRVVFKIDGQVACTHTSGGGDQIPATATLLRHVETVTTLTTAAKSISHGWIYVESDK